MKKNIVLLLALAFGFASPAFADTLSVPCLQLNGAGSGCNPVSGTNPLPVGSYAPNSSASITRPTNTTTYTANTAWNATSPTFFTFTNVCTHNGGSVLIPEIDIYSSANPTTKLTGNLWLFAAVPGTNIDDDINFNIAAADFANLTGGSFNGIAFSLASAQGSGAANSGVSLTGTTYQANCAADSRNITGMVEVTNAYVPASGEKLTIKLQNLGNN